LTGENAAIRKDVHVPEGTKQLHASGYNLISRPRGKRNTAHWWPGIQSEGQTAKSEEKDQMSPQDKSKKAVIVSSRGAVKA